MLKNLINRDNFLLSLRALLIFLLLFFNPSWQQVVGIIILIFGNQIIDLANSLRVEHDKNGNKTFSFQKAIVSKDIGGIATIRDGILNSNTNANNIDKISDYKIPEFSIECFRPILKIYESEINKQINDLRANKFSDNQIIEIGVRDLADFKIALDFERIYQIIFGSQLKLLERISILNYIDYSEIENFYKESGISMDQYSLRDWINYLKTSNLIETNDNKTVLTIKGNAFIEYINMHYKNLIKKKIL